MVARAGWNPQAAYAKALMGQNASTASQPRSLFANALSGATVNPSMADMTVQANSGDPRDWPYAYKTPGGVISSPDTSLAQRSGIFYGKGYETAPALQNQRTLDDYTAAQMYATHSAITGLGFNPNAVQLQGNTKDLAGGANPGTETLGKYNPPQSMGARAVSYINSLLGYSPPQADTIDVAIPPLSSGNDGVPTHFSPRVVAHESSHRGLQKMVDDVYGNDSQAGWVDTSRFTPQENQAIESLRNGDLHGSGNEYLTRLLEAKLTGDNSGVSAIMGNPLIQKAYNSSMSQQDRDHYAAMLTNLESAAAKIEAQRRPSGPR